MLQRDRGKFLEFEPRANRPALIIERWMAQIAILETERTLALAVGEARPAITPCMWRVIECRRIPRCAHCLA